MKLLVDFLPVVIFFIVYKFFGIYAATASAIGISVIQVAVSWFKDRHVSNLQWISLILLVVLGGGTLFLHNEMLIKWKPTVLNWTFAIAFIATQLFTEKPLIQRLMESNISLPKQVWLTLNMSWTIFFIVMGILNLLVAYHFDTNVWVNFKLFGMLGLTIVFAVLQAIYLSRHVRSESQPEENLSS